MVFDAPAKKQPAPSVAAKQQQASPPVKVTAKTDEAMLLEQRVRLDEISAIEKAPGTAKVTPAAEALWNDPAADIKAWAAAAAEKLKQKLRKV